MRSSEALEADVAERLIRGLRRVGFFIFDAREHHHVSKLLSRAGLHHMLRIKAVDSAKRIFIVEVDSRVYRPQCREKCSSNGILNLRCYGKCVEEGKLNLLKDALRKLENAANESSH